MCNLVIKYFLCLARAVVVGHYYFAIFRQTPVTGAQEYEYLKAIHRAGSRWSGALAHYKLVCQADGGIAPNWRQIKLATHYVLAKTFKLFWPPLPQLITALFGLLFYFPHRPVPIPSCSVLYCPVPGESGRIGMATNHGQLLNGLLSENYGTPKTHKAFTMPRPGQRRLVTFFIVTGLGSCRNPFAVCLP